MACRKMSGGPARGPNIITVRAYLGLVGLAGPLEVGKEIGGGNSVGDVRSFLAEVGGGGMSENVAGPARGPNNC